MDAPAHADDLELARYTARPLLKEEETRI